MIRMASSADIPEAREAHAYWSRRAATLPWHRRAARREARELAARWRVRLVTAYLESWHLGVVADAVAPRFGMRRRRPPIGRMLLATVTAIVTVWFVCVALVVAVAVQLVS